MQNRAKASGYNKLQMGKGKGGERENQKTLMMETEYTQVSSQDQIVSVWKSGLTRVPGPISLTNWPRDCNAPCPQQPSKGGPIAKGQGITLALLVE